VRVYSDVDLDKLPSFAYEELVRILDREGEWSNDKHDHPTKWGIIQATADACGITKPLHEITYTEALQCWALGWWFNSRYDMVAQVSELICSQIIDTSGPAGVSQGTKHMQNMLNQLNDPVDAGGNRYGVDLEEDGLIGGKTVSRLQAYISHRGQEGIFIFAMIMNAYQASHYRFTAERNEGKRDFIFGWWRERVFRDMVAIAEAYQQWLNEPHNQPDNYLGIT